jgi:hypothetical protein
MSKGSMHLCAHLQGLQQEFRQWLEQQIASDDIVFSAKGPAGLSGSLPMNASERHAAEAVVQRNKEESLLA